MKMLSALVASLITGTVLAAPVVVHNYQVGIDTNWFLTDSDQDPGRNAFAYNDPVTVSASNRNGDVALGNAFEPSGLYWHDRQAVLYAVGDEGQIGRMNFDGSQKSNFVWSTGLDIEAVTCADESGSLIDLGCERWLSNADRDMIVRMIFGNGFSDANQQRFDVSAIVEAAVANSGLEALTFIPSNAIPSWVTNTFDEPLGCYLMASQESGTWYLVDVPISTTALSTNIIILTDADIVAEWTPQLLYGVTRADCADLHYDRRWNRLYALYDEEGGEVTDLSGRGRSIYLFDAELNRAVQEWGLWATNTYIASPEGFALGPDRHYAFIANDVGNSADSGIIRYRFDAYGREGRGEYLDVTLPFSPDDDDDATLGYDQGSLWFDTSTTSLWTCVSAADGAAIWRTIANREWFMLGHILTNELGTIYTSNLYVNGSSLYIGGVHLGASGSLMDFHNHGITNVATNGISFYDGSVLNPSWMTSRVLDNAARAQETTALDARLSRDEIDILNNYINDATENATGVLPLLWAFSDTFTTNSYVSELFNATWSQADELYSFAASVETGTLGAWLPMTDNAANQAITDAASDPGGAAYYFTNNASWTTDGATTNGPSGDPNTALYIPADTSIIGEDESFYVFTNSSVGSVGIWFWATNFEDTASDNYMYMCDTFDGTFGYDNEFCAMVLSREPVWGGGYYIQWFSGNDAVAYVQAYKTVDTNYLYSWHHVAMVHDGSTAGDGERTQMYLDGVNITDTTTLWSGSRTTDVWWNSANAGNFNKRWVLGCDPRGAGYTAEPFHGMLADFRVTTNIWTDADVAAIYNSGVGITTEGIAESVDQAYLVTSNRVYATEDTGELYLSAQLEIGASDTTNVLLLASNEDPPSWVTVPFVTDYPMPNGVLSVSGTTNTGSAGTNLIVKVVVTNAIPNVKLHSIGYGRY